MEPVHRLKKVYISGAMTGLPDNNFPAFDEAAHLVAIHGLMFSNPANIARDIFYEVEHGIRPMPCRYGFMREDIKAMCDCNAVLLLQGWQKSWGAKWERIIAKYVFDMPIFESIDEAAEWANTPLE